MRDKQETWLIVLCMFIAHPVIWSIGLAACLIGLFALFSPAIDPLDKRTFLDKRETVLYIELMDSACYGFQAAFVTNNPVNSKRIEEIRSRQSVRELRQKIDIDELVHKRFRYNFRDADIYDVASYMEQLRVDKDFSLYHIIANEKLGRLYIGPNPNMYNASMKYNPETNQGAIYLNEFQIRGRNAIGRTYSYWKCNLISTKDERYSHFTENEYISSSQ